ncbi:MAG: amidohydrolase [Planctomycetales bacterium]|nr:MAG: amidohydrolase [Planctomycetales bacterium]
MSAIKESLLPGVNIDEVTRAAQPDVVSNRRYLHEHPEVGMETHETATYIEKQLTSYGLEAKRCAETGVISMIDSGAEGPTVMLRADIDALPITEENTHGYESKTVGKMHACGHDTHTAMQLAVSRRLKEEGISRGRIKLLYQPGEEGHHGAQKMIADSALKGPDVTVCYGQHIWAGCPTGKIQISAGPVMAAVDTVHIVIHGKGTHAAFPHGGNDPIYCGAQIVTALQSVVSRNIDPLKSAVITVSEFHAGTAHNIIPPFAKLTMSVRVFERDVHQILKRRIHEVVNGIADSLGCNADIDYSHEQVATVNDARVAELVREEAIAIVGAENVTDDQQTMGAEDFSDFLAEVPGAFAFVGAANTEKECIYPHHHPKFNIDEDAMAIGNELMYRVAKRLLAEY